MVLSLIAGTPTDKRRYDARSISLLVNDSKPSELDRSRPADATLRLLLSKSTILSPN